MEGAGARRRGRLTPPDGAVARVFYALWPPAALQRGLGAIAIDLAGECGGRAVPAHNIHMTLAFVGNVPRARLADLAAAASAVACAPFAFEIDRIGWWRHNRIAWAGASRVPDALVSLAAGLAAAARQRGFDIAPRPWVPHVTLLRNARRAPAADTVPARPWRATGFALVESTLAPGGSRYRPVARWPLGRAVDAGI